MVIYYLAYDTLQNVMETEIARVSTIRIVYSRAYILVWYKISIGTTLFLFRVANINLRYRFNDSTCFAP